MVVLGQILLWRVWEQKYKETEQSGVTKRLIRKNKKKSSFRKSLHHHLLMSKAAIWENHYTIIY